MSEYSEVDSVLQQQESATGLEVARNTPEIIANSPLENTTLIYSVPAMGEWKNGNLLRMLHGMFAQRPKEGEAFEVEVISNIGNYIGDLLVLNETGWGSKKNESGDYLLDTTTPGDERKQKAMDRLRETDQGLAYMKKIVEAQRLQRTINAQPEDSESQNNLDALLEAVGDPLEKEILQLAIDKVDTTSLAVIDATRFLRDRNPYGHIVSMFSLRTLGVDVAAARFAANPNAVLALYDADTVPETNNAIAQMQEIYASRPDLKYVFSGISNLPVGHSQGFVADAPGENIRRTYSYNSYAAHGSPQISFRLNAYEKLSELAGWVNSGFQGDEDRDTAYRLIYHFGALQDGLLLEGSEDVYPPTSLTADRLDGSFDSVGRNDAFQKNGTRFMTRDIASVLAFEEQLFEFADRESPEKKQEVLDSLEKAREHFKRKQEVQQRFNRRVLNTFFTAIDKEFIKLENGEMIVADQDLTTLVGGDALLHYIRSNRDLVTQTLSSPEDLEVIKYYIGRSEKLPDHELTPFQLAIREYVGDVEILSQLSDEGKLQNEKVGEGKDMKWQVEDMRKPEEKVSIMHSSVAEMLALGDIYRKYFENRDFLSTREKVRFSWPENPDAQDISYNFGSLKKRLQEVTDKYKTHGTEIPTAEYDPKQNGLEDWMIEISTRSFPIFELFKALEQRPSAKI